MLTMDIWRLTRLVIISLVLPVLVAVVADYLLDTLPWITIMVSLVVIPLSSIVVIRASLVEFDKIIQDVAPVDVANDAVVNDS